jgi:hypothetical protein
MKDVTLTTARGCKANSERTWRLAGDWRDRHAVLACFEWSEDLDLHGRVSDFSAGGSAGYLGLAVI